MKIRPVFKLLALGAALVAVLAFGFALTATGDQAVTSVGAAQKVPASGTVEASAPVTRTWEEMKRDEAQMAPAGAPQVIPFRPTIPQAKLDELKAQGAAIPAGSKGEAAPAAPEPLGPPVVGVNFNGIVGGPGTANAWWPPDTHGAVGPLHFIQVNNSRIDVWTKAGAYAAGNTLNGFFGYAAAALFDPRAVYDELAGRWLIQAVAFAESATVQRLFVAVSATNNPFGAWFVYNFNVRFFPGGFWDFPMIGFNATNVIFTANYFAPAFVDARMFTVTKQQMYAGLAITPAPILWTGLPATLAPPIVRDNNSIAYLVAATPVNNGIFVLGLELATPFNPVLFAYTPIPVPAYTVPPNAPQPFTNRLLDTLDSRFVNMSSQVGNSIFQVHTIALGPFAVPRWYEFDCFLGIVLQGGQFFKSATSWDFNASIAAAANRTAFVTWNSTDPAGGGTANNRRVQVRAAGRLATDAAGAMLGNILIAFSPRSYRYAAGVQRWGDYSAVSIDPAPPAGATRAFLANERVVIDPAPQTPATSRRWGSRIASLINVP